MNATLRQALADKRLSDVDVATALDVDPKTVQRWISGRVPQRRHRWGLADLVSRHENDLWPRLTTYTGSLNGDIRAVYPYRSAVPRDVWRDLFRSASEGIDILVYSGLFLAEDVELIRVLGERARSGVAVRILLGDPDSPTVRQRGIEEGIGDAIAAKIRNAIVLYRPLLGVEHIDIRLHDTALYNSIYRADDEMLVNTHVYGMAAAHAPILHLCNAHDNSMAGTYLASFDRVWRDAPTLAT